MKKLFLQYGKLIGKAHIDDGTKLGKWVKITSMKRYPGSPFFCKVMDVDGVTHEQVPLIKVKIKTIIPDENPSGIAAVGVPEYGEKLNGPIDGIPQWIIDYDTKNFTSSAGKAIRILITMLKESVSRSPQAQCPTCKQYKEALASILKKEVDIQWFVENTKRMLTEPPPQAESDEDLWAELGNKINKHMEPLHDAFGIHPLLDLYGKQHFTITRKP